MLQSKTLNEAQTLIKETEMIKITLRKKGNYPYYQARFTIQGKPYEKSTKETDKVKARSIAKDIVYEMLAREKYPTTLGSHSFDEAVERRLMEDISYNDKRYLKWFQKNLKGYLLSEIDKDTIWKLKQKYKKERPNIKNQSINRPFNTFHGLLSDCVDWDWIEHAPKNQKLKEQPPKMRRTLTKKEYDLLREVSFKLGHPEIWDLIDWYCHSGMRKTEAHKIKKEHINLEEGTYYIPDQKNEEKNQIIYLNSVQLKIAAKRMRTKGELLFDITNFRKRWEKVRAEAGIEDIDIHCLRHTATTNVARHCKNREELKAFTRHKSDAGLKPYLHLIEEEDRKRIQELSTKWLS
jgi:integrase